MEILYSDDVEGSKNEENKQMYTKCKYGKESPLKNTEAKRRYRYTKEELMKYKSHPLSTNSPTLSENLKFLFNSAPMKSQRKEEYDTKKSALKKSDIIPTFEKCYEKVDVSKKNEHPRAFEKSSVTFRTDKSDDVRKTTDVASRLRKDPEICLSPQRKSFNSGCSVQNLKAEGNLIPENHPNNNSTNVNSKQNGPKDSSFAVSSSATIRENLNESREKRSHELPPRRIGSGRIINTDPCIHDYSDNRVMYREKPQVVFKCTFQKSVERDRESVWDKQKNTYTDKRKYSDQNYAESRDQQQRVISFFERRRQYNSDSYNRDRNDEENEPEWIKEGPDSKHDIIELRGFDENEVRSFRKERNVVSSSSAGNGTNERANKIRNSTVNYGNVEISVSRSVQENGIKGDSRVSGANTVKSPEAHSIEINLEEIFKSPVADIISEDKMENSGSRFTQWFKREETSGPNENIANKTSGTFTNTEKVSDESASKLGNATASSSNLLNLFRVSQMNKCSPKVDVKILASGKLHSLEEIESKLRRTETSKTVAPNALGPDCKKKEEELEAFKKLLFQASRANSTIVNCQKLIENYRSISDVFVQKMRNERQDVTQGKPNVQSAFCNDDSLINVPCRVAAAQISKMHSMGGNSSAFQQHMQLPHQLLHLHQPHQQSADIMRLFHQQQHHHQTKSQQELFSRMLMCSGSNYNSSISSPTFTRPLQAEGPYSHVNQEIQIWVNNFAINNDVIKRPETKSLLAGIRHGELTVYHLIEQLKKTTPYQTRFRESVLCILKYLQLYEPHLAACPTTTLSFAVPPPQSSTASASSFQPASQAPQFSENMVKQMIINQQYRSAAPDIVYQRDFSSHSQNVFHTNTANVGKKLGPSQLQNINQSLSIREAKIGESPIININPPSSVAMHKSLSLTPTSVLLKLSAEKENQEYVSIKELTEIKRDDSMKPVNVNQSAIMKDSFVNGFLPDGDQLNHLFPVENLNLSQSKFHTTSTTTPQNMISLEEIERVQKSVCN